jgi:hypothetical protein
MPARESRDTRPSEAEIRAAVTRLSRPDGAGGAVIERAAILAEGTPSSAIEAWIIDHGGQPDTAMISGPAGGLHRSGRGTPSSDRRAPQRYVVPAAALQTSS